jgi:hypothetical protein
LPSPRHWLRSGLTAIALLGLVIVPTTIHAAGYELNDSHFHLTNYIQQGIDIRKFLDIMGSRVWRVALFGIPLQQAWSYRVSGDDAPK